MNFLEKVKIEKFSVKDTEDVKKLIKKIYSGVGFKFSDMHLYENLTENFFKYDISYLEESSIKAVYNNKIIGVMLLSECPIHWFLEDKYNDIYENKKCLKSDFFGVDTKHQKKGLGTKMINYIKEKHKDYDYLWGIQHESISNIDFFLKRREIVSENIGDGFYTIQNLRD